MADDYQVKDAAGAPFFKAAKDIGGGRKADLAVAPGGAFTDVSATLSAGQAAGTTAAIAANPNRTGFAITPNADGRVYFTGTATSDGPYFPLYAGVTFLRVGGECPTGALFVTGQGAVKLRMGEA